ncbi:S1C family serine protease [Magnetospirillum molischianum]|nr:serine protease [Magnetospirillum molischianum]
MMDRKLAVCLAFLLGLSLPAMAEAGPEVAAQKQRNQALQEYVGKLQTMLKGDPCATPVEAQALLMSDPTSSAVQPSADKAYQAPDKASPQPVSNGKALDRQDLVERLHKAVVLVIADHGTGSGFFVAPNLVVTNNHVVETSKGSEVVVIGQGLSGPRPAKILTHVAGQGFGARDYALLQVEGPGVAQVLTLTDKVEELEKVVAAGYPGLLLDNDMAFRSLLKGDLKSMPELAMSQGTVMALQNRDRLLTIAHSAPISGGNSGGPLVDQCGRVVGINTYINVSVQQASSAGFAIAAKDVIAYLRENGVAPSTVDGACGD